MTKKHDVRIDTKLLHPQLEHKLNLLLKKCAAKGIYLIITEGFRTVARQEELYAQGRTKPGKIVTNAKGTSYSSQHMWGVAFDIAINDSKHTYDYALIKKVAEIAKAKGVGLGWGGDWKSFPDTPHFYLKRWGSTASKLKAQYGTPDRFKKTWSRKVTRRQGLKLWKSVAKTGSYFTIPCGAKVRVLFLKLWYAKVEYNGKVGYINKKYLG